MSLDPARLQALIGGLAGAIFFALVQVSAMLLSGQTLSRWDVIRASLNIVMGVMAGVLAAPVLAPALAPLIPFESLRDPLAVGFAVGAFAWELAPFVVSFAKRFAAKKVGEVGG